MGEKNKLKYRTYYNYAQDDYDILEFLVHQSKVSGGICSMGQNIIERYLKFIVDTYVRPTIRDKSSEDRVYLEDVLRTHNLRKILKFLSEYLPDFEINISKVLLANGYYFTARYPSDESLEVNDYDIEIVWEACKETKRAVDNYIVKKYNS